MGSTAADGPPAPDPELTGRFAAALRALWPGCGQGEYGKAGLAVSGGPDSTALLLLAASAFPGEVEAATVDHGLRPEAAREAADVARLCERLGVHHEVLKVDVAPGNVQAEARRARYAALTGWIERRGLGALLTAHHADDQAETLLLRLNRASGVAGLAGTRARGFVPGTEIPLLRPLLDWRRVELTRIVEAAGIDAAQDPSNEDDRFDRARLRKALANTDWLDIDAIAESASHLADADAALDWAARREWSECVRKEGLGILYRPKAPRAVALRVIARIAKELEGSEPRGSAVARLFDALLARQPGSIGDLVARPTPDGWSFMKAPKRRAKG
ncbi:MAG: tRNA lysidine(34) synthetase TilS [Novosphingobium sp.]|nr:tRNA lysidine(34) synthetase TilS [Novosphingobium sp.]